MNGKERIAEQSRTWLWESLEELLHQKKFSQITITEICSNADLTRKTFYNSFKNKEDLVVYQCRKVVNQYFKELQNIPSNKRTLEETLKTFLYFWWDNRNWLLLLKSQNLFSVLVDTWLATASTRYNCFEASWHMPSNNKEETKYLMSFILGGLANVLSVWFSNKHPKSPDKMYIIIKHIISNH
ncbi:TetR/AcrR family transcriptional regulator [Ligilactobacillus cholophilus]|uniref:TetR/AcrR family transcriptional regulator n=1 Tax=Ligilactobacillus cholophilus TaxID=3050131 RepID=UPI0025B22D7C|nr:TetR/AcrR family transcriptional regulator [Ligilactobacillus cholophilus]